MRKPGAPPRDLGLLPRPVQVRVRDDVLPLFPLPVHVLFAVGMPGRPVDVRGSLRERVIVGVGGQELGQAAPEVFFGHYAADLLGDAAAEGVVDVFDGLAAGEGDAKKAAP